MWVSRGWSPTLTPSHHSLAATPRGCHTCHGPGRVQGPLGVSTSLSPLHPSQLATASRLLSVSYSNCAIQRIILSWFHPTNLKEKKNDEHSSAAYTYVNLFCLHFVCFYHECRVLLECVAEGREHQTAECQLSWHFVFADSHGRQYVQEQSWTSTRSDYHRYILLMTRNRTQIASEIFSHPECLTNGSWFYRKDWLQRLRWIGGSEESTTRIRRALTAINPHSWNGLRDRFWNSLWFQVGIQTDFISVEDGNGLRVLAHMI